MSLLLALQGSSPDITGSGASVLVLTDTGAGLEVFAGSGASVLALTDTGSGLEVFTGSGASVLALTDAGSGIVEQDITGSGASVLALTDDGAGTVVGEVIAGPGGGGGFSFHEHRDTVRDFRRLLRPERERPKRAAKRGPKAPPIFGYASDSVLTLTSAGHGSVSMQAGGSSRLRLTSAGRGRIEQSAEDILRLLVAMDEI